MDPPLGRFERGGGPPSFSCGADQRAPLAAALPQLATGTICDAKQGVVALGMCYFGNSYNRTC